MRGSGWFLALGLFALFGGALGLNGLRATTDSPPEEESRAPSPPSAPPLPSEPARVVPGEERIVFQSDADGDSEIYSLRPDGTGLLKLTDNEVVDCAPSWRGGKICFVRLAGEQGEIWAMGPDGSGERRISARPKGRIGYSCGPPVISPDGKWIAWRENSGEVILGPVEQGYLYEAEKGRVARKEWRDRFQFFNQDKDYRVWSNRHFLYLADVATGKVQGLPLNMDSLQRLYIVGWMPAGEELLCGFHIHLSAFCGSANGRALESLNLRTGKRTSLGLTIGSHDTARAFLPGLLLTTPALPEVGADEEEATRVIFDDDCVPFEVRRIDDKGIGPVIHRLDWMTKEAPGQYRPFRKVARCWWAFGLSPCGRYAAVTTYEYEKNAYGGKVYEEHAPYYLEVRELATGKRIRRLGFALAPDREASEGCPQWAVVQEWRTAPKPPAPEVF